MDSASAVQVSCELVWLHSGCTELLQDFTKNDVPWICDSGSGILQLTRRIAGPSSTDSERYKERSCRDWRTVDLSGVHGHRYARAGSGSLRISLSLDAWKSTVARDGSNVTRQRRNRVIICQREGVEYNRLFRNNRLTCAATRYALHIYSGTCHYYRGAVGGRLPVLVCV